MTQTDQQNVPKLRFPGFKGDWIETSLSKLVTSHNSGIYKKKELYGSGTNIIGVSNFYSVDSVDGQDFSQVPLTEHEISQFGLHEGDIIYTESSLVRSGIAKALFVTDRGEGTAFAWHTRRFKVDRDRVFPAFLYFELSSETARKFITSVATQTALTGITTKDYFRTPIHLPTLPEQRKIAAFLSAVDTKIAQLARKKALFEDYKKGCMQQLFSQKIRFKDANGKDFPDWEEKRLGEIFSEIADGGTPSKSNDDFFGGHIPWVVIEDIQPRIYKTKNTLTPEGLASSSAKLWPAGSVILSTGATIGRVGIADVPLATKQGICGIVPSDGVNNVWVYFLLQTLAPKFERLAQGNTIKEVRAPTIKKIVAHLPHPDEQRKIADFLSAIDRKIELVGQELEHAKTLKKWLLQQMFV